jgi:hypothetical protein
VSGFSATRPGVFDLTHTKAVYWHRSQPECACDDLDAIYATHLEPAGFQRQPAPSPALLRLTGPGIAQGHSTRVYEAISGRRSHYPQGAPWERRNRRGGGS